MTEFSVLGDLSLNYYLWKKK